MGRRLILGTLVALSLLSVPISASDTPGMATAGQSFDRATFEVTVLANGSARWTFRYERPLNETDRPQFREFADRFNRNRTELYADFRNQSAALVAHGERATGRNMTATSFERRAYVERGLNDIGVVEMSFTWEAFAATNGSHVFVGDAFEGGLYLARDQAFVVRAGRGLRFAAVSPVGTPSGASLADSDTVTWEGERTFTDNRPRVVLVRTDVPPTGTAAASRSRSPAGSTGSADSATVTRVRTGSRAATSTSPPAGGSSPLVAAIAIVAVLGIGLGAAFLLRRSESSGSVFPGASAERSEGGSAAGADLVDDHERVVSLLRGNDGRMRQSAIVEETGWSKSKVSMVLSEMEEDERITKIRIGRENLISLPGYEPDAAGPPHRD